MWTGVAESRCAGIGYGTTVVFCCILLERPLGETNKIIEWQEFDPAIHAAKSTDVKAPI